MNLRPPQKTMPAQQRSGATVAESAPFIADAPISVRNFLHTVWLGKWMVLFWCLVAIGLGIQYLSVTAPLYTAEADVVLKPQENQVVDLESVVSGMSADSATINTEVAIMTSRAILNTVVEKLELDKDPEFNPDLRGEPNILEKAIASARGLLSSVIATDQSQAAALTPEFRTRQKAIEILEDKLSVSNLRDSFVFLISVQTQNAEKSARIANTLAATYIDKQLEEKFDATRKATEWLGDEVLQLRNNLEDAEAAVEDFTASASLESEEALEMANLQLKSLRGRRAEQLKREQEIRNSVEAARTALDAGDVAAVAAAVDDRQVDLLARRIAATESDEAKAALTEDLDQQVSRWIDASNAQADRLASQSDLLAQTISAEEAKIKERSGDLVQLRQLQREAQASQVIYEYFLTRMKETSVQEGIQQANSRVLSEAVPPEYPSHPRKGQILALAGLLGLMFGAGVVVARENLKSTFRSPEELEGATGLPVMGTIPRAPTRAPLDYVIDRPSSRLAEAVRNLRTSVLLSNLDHTPQIILVSSSVPGEGKSSTTLMLAQISRSLGKKVLLIECDIRRSTFTKYFDTKVDHGLLSLLSGEAGPEEVIHYEERSGLDVIFGQESQANPADIFSSERFVSFLARMRQQYDFIYIDTPPVLAVPDARIVGQHADAVLYMVRWDSTSADQVQAGLKLFQQALVKVSGLALTQANPKKMRRYGYEGYGSRSASGYYSS